MPAITIEIDASDLRDKIERLQANMKPEQFERAMYGIFQRTGRHVAKILRQDLPKQYEVKAGDISAAVKSAQLSGVGGGVGCSIPIRAVRGKIGSQYKASGGAHGWKSVKRRYKVKARIIKGTQSTLPDKWHSGYPPFRNLGSKLGGLTFARSSKARGPILKVTGIAIPQMPMNRSEADVQQDIKDYLERQMEQRFMALIRIGK